MGSALLQQLDVFLDPRFGSQEQRRPSVTVTQMHRRTLGEKVPKDIDVGARGYQMLFMPCCVSDFYAGCKKKDTWLKEDLARKDTRNPGIGKGRRCGEFRGCKENRQLAARANTTLCNGGPRER